MKYSELSIMQAEDLDRKIITTQVVIRKAFALSKKPALAFSGGKDSTVLLHLIRQTEPEKSAGMPIIYGNTGVEFPECVSFVRGIAKDWNLNLHEAHPGKTTEPGLKYKAQRELLDTIQSSGQISEILKPDGKLKSTRTLEQFLPGNFPQFEKYRLVWPAGTLMSYWWCADQYGYPLLGKAWSKLDARRINIDVFLSHSQSISTDPILLSYYKVLRQVKISQHCCQVLKKEPSQLVQEKLGVDLIFKGLMASESRSRAKNFLTRGWLFEGAKKPYLNGALFFHCQPLATWNEKDIWDYIHRFSVPYSTLYDIGYISHDGSRKNIRRNGCMGCATDLAYKDNHLFALRQTHPRAWKVFMRSGLGQEIRNLQHVLRTNQMDIFDVFPTNELIEAQPCIFDDLDGLGGKPELSDELTYDSEL